MYMSTYTYPPHYIASKYIYRFSSIFTEFLAQILVNTEKLEDLVHTLYNNGTFCKILKKHAKNKRTAWRHCHHCSLLLYNAANLQQELRELLKPVSI